MVYLYLSHALLFLRGTMITATLGKGSIEFKLAYGFGDLFYFHHGEKQ